jgi:hypothetical protein
MSAWRCVHTSMRRVVLWLIAMLQCNLAYCAWCIHAQLMINSAIRDNDGTENEQQL